MLDLLPVYNSIVWIGKVYGHTEYSISRIHKFKLIYVLEFKKFFKSVSI